MSLRMSRKLIIFELFTIKVYAKIYARFSVQNKQKKVILSHKNCVLWLCDYCHQSEAQTWNENFWWYIGRMMGCWYILSKPSKSAKQQYRMLLHNWTRIGSVKFMDLSFYKNNIGDNIQFNFLSHYIYVMIYVRRVFIVKSIFYDFG